MALSTAVEDGITGDNAMERRLFTSLSPAEQEAFLEKVRDRRLAPIRLYQEAQAKRANIRSQRTLAMIEKQSAMMEKEIAALDKALAKVEARATMIAALTNQVEMNV